MAPLAPPPLASALLSIILLFYFIDVFMRNRGTNSGYLFPVLWDYEVVIKPLYKPWQLAIKGQPGATFERLLYNPFLIFGMGTSSVYDLNTKKNQYLISLISTLRL